MSLLPRPPCSWPCRAGGPPQGEGVRPGWCGGDCIRKVSLSYDTYDTYSDCSWMQLDINEKHRKTLEYFTCQVSQIGLPGRSGRRGGSLCPQILSAQTASRRKEPFSGDDIFCFCMCMYIYSSNFSKNQQLAVVTFLVLCKPQYFTIREPYFPIFYSAKC